LNHSNLTDITRLRQGEIIVDLTNPSPPEKKSKSSLLSLQNSAHLSLSGSPETNRNKEQKAQKSQQTIDGWLLPKRPPVCQADGTFVKPVRISPNNLEWDENEDLWIPEKCLMSP
jgi:hypothetical protein